MQPRSLFLFFKDSLFEYTNISKLNYHLVVTKVRPQNILAADDICIKKCLANMPKSV